MAPLDCYFYVSPNTITDLTLWIDGVQATESTPLKEFHQQIDGNYILCSFSGHGGTHNVLKATGYQDCEISIYEGSAAYYEMVPKTYVSSITHGDTAYTIKDAEARQTLTTKQDTLVSGTNIKTINNTSMLGSGNIDTFPSQTGNANKSLVTNGTTTSWQQRTKVTIRDWSVNNS